MPGYDVQILDEGGHPMKPGELGAIAVKLPLPPGTLPTLWNAEAKGSSKSYLEHLPRLLRNRRCWDDRRGWISLYHGAHR